MKSRGVFAKSSNEDGEDATGSSSDADLSSDDDEGNSPYEDKIVDREIRQKHPHLVLSSSAQTGCGAPAGSSGTRSSARNRGELLPSLHSLGLYNNKDEVSSSMERHKIRCFS